MADLKNVADSVESSVYSAGSYDRIKKNEGIPLIHVVNIEVKIK